MESLFWDQSKNLKMICLNILIRILFGIGLVWGIIEFCVLLALFIKLELDIKFFNLINVLGELWENTELNEDRNNVGNISYFGITIYREILN